MKEQQAAKLIALKQKVKKDHYQSKKLNHQKAVKFVATSQANSYITAEKVAKAVELFSEELSRNKDCKLQSFITKIQNSSIRILT